MIKANELRIDNWIMVGNPAVDTEPEYRQIAYVGDTIGLRNEIGGTDKYQRNPIFSYDIEDLHPIPLSPQILEACGFERRDSEVLFLSISVLTNSGLWYSGSDMYIHQFGSAGIIVPCEYLHQLQNLTFSLTGSELTVNLTQKV